jgi:hypothetical protein
MAVSHGGPPFPSLVLYGSPALPFIVFEQGVEVKGSGRLDCRIWFF